MMKKLGILLTSTILLSSVFVVNCYSIESCLKCHGTKEKLSGYIKKVPAKSGEELVNYLRTKSLKKALHNGVTDEQIRQAFAEIGKK